MGKLQEWLFLCSQRNMCYRIILENTKEWVAHKNDREKNNMFSRGEKSLYFEIIIFYSTLKTTRKVSEISD